MDDRFERHEPELDGYADAAIPAAYDRRNQRVSLDDAGPEIEDAVYADDREDETPAQWGDRLKAVPAKAFIAGAACIAFVIVAVNAALFQPGAHPAPMMATRDLGPSDRLPAGVDGGEALPRDVAVVPAPISRPLSTEQRTASIPQPTAVPGAPDLNGLARAPYVAPAPTPRPLSFARAPSQIPPAVSQPLPPIPAVAPRPVQTIPLADPIAALLQPIAPLPEAENNAAQPLVAAIQAVLAQLGYAPGSVDGVMGPGTEEAIRRFQLRRALEPNGQITGDLIREIERVTGQRVSAS